MRERHIAHSELAVDADHPNIIANHVSALYAHEDGDLALRVGAADFLGGSRQRQVFAVLLDVLTHQINLVERLLNRRRPESPAGNEDGEKLRIEAALAHPGNVNVAFRITVAKIERAGKHPLRRIRMRIQDNRGEVKLVCALRNIIRGSAAGEKEPCT